MGLGWKVVNESAPPTKTPDVPTEMITCPPFESVSVFTAPTLAVEPPGSIMPDEPAIALIVCEPTTTMALGLGAGIGAPGCVVGLGWNVVRESDPPTKIPDVPTETITLPPFESVNVLTAPTLAVEPPGTMMPDDPAIALSVFVPITMTLRDGAGGEGLGELVFTGGGLPTNTPPGLVEGTGSRLGGGGVRPPLGVGSLAEGSVGIVSLSLAEDSVGFVSLTVVVVLAIWSGIAEGGALADS